MGAVAGLRHLAIELPGERVQFLSGPAQRLGVVAEDLLGRAFDALPESIDGRPGAGFGGTGRSVLAKVAQKTPEAEAQAGAWRNPIELRFA